MENNTGSSVPSNQNNTNDGSEDKPNPENVIAPSANGESEPTPKAAGEQSVAAPAVENAAAATNVATVGNEVSVAAPAQPAAPAPADLSAGQQPSPVAVAGGTVTGQVPSAVSGETQSVPPIAGAATPAPAPGKKHSHVPIIAAVVVVVLLLSLGGFFLYKGKSNTPAKTTANIKIGLMMAFSGGDSAMGYGTSKGVALAKKQLSADNITVVQADSKCDPKAAVQAINQLIKQHVVAIIGDGCSSASLAALPTANNAQIPLISPSASSTKLSIANDYFFRVIPNDNYQGAFMAQTVHNRGLKNVAVFYTNEPYGASIEQAFQNKFESLGGKVVATAISQPNVIALSSQIATLKAANPQAIFFAPNSVTTGIAAVKLARQAGIKAPFFGADVYYDHTIISNAAADVEGMEFTTFPTGTPAFKQAISAAYPNDAQLYAAPEAYDAFKAIYLAIQHGATTGQEIKSTLPTIKFQGVSANINFDQYGDLSATSGYQYALFKVTNGAFVQQN